MRMSVKLWFSLFVVVAWGGGSFTFPAQALGGSLEPVVGQRQDGAQESAKIDLSVLYVGKLGSDREKDFVELFGKHFRQVQRENLAGFETTKARDADVIMLDYYGAGVNEAQLPADYSTPTLMTGWAGSTIIADRSRAQKAVGSSYR